MNTVPPKTEALTHSRFRKHEQEASSLPSGLFAADKGGDGDRRVVGYSITGSALLFSGYRQAAAAGKCPNSEIRISDVSSICS